MNVDGALELSSKIAAAITKAGPLIPETAAYACVTRLHLAHPWAKRVAADLTGLSVPDIEPVVIDRLGAIRVAAQIGSEMPIRRLSPFLLRRIAKEIRGVYWHQPVLVAPNIYETAVKYQLDQADFAKWVVLRTLLWGTYLKSAPWILDALLSGEVEVMVLLSEATTLITDRLGPSQLASVNWIRRHLPPDGTLVEMYPDLVPLRSTALRFLTSVGFHEDPSLLKTLLASRVSFPSMVEMENPDAWNRVSR